VAIQVAIVLLLVFVSFGLFTVITYDIVPARGALFVTFQNSSNATMTVSVFVYVIDMENASNVGFTNATFTKMHNDNRTYVASIADGSGIEVYMRNVSAGESRGFHVNDATVSPQLCINPSQLKIEITPREGSLYDLDYDVIFLVIAKVGFWEFSATSIKVFNHRSNSISKPMQFERNHAATFIGLFFLLAFCSLSSLVVWIANPKWRTRIPLATLVVALSSVAIYSFIGSGWEILARLSAAGNAAIAYPASFLLHGYDNHLSGNILFFMLVSLLLESWQFVRKTRQTFLFFYALPLFLTLIFPGIGLSLSIESMTWALWTKVLNDRTIFTRLDVLMCLLSGLPSAVFFYWLVPYLQGSFYLFDRVLAINHIEYGILSAAIIFGGFAVWSLLNRKRTQPKPTRSASALKVP